MKPAQGDFSRAPQIAVFGSASGTILDADRAKAAIVGRTVAKAGCTLVFGAGHGLPFEAAKGAKEAGGMVVGISPAASLQEHVDELKFPVFPADALVFTGFGKNGRNIILVRSADAAIVIGGGFGTLNEVTGALQERRPLGVLTGTSGIAGVLESVIKASSRPLASEVVYGGDPAALAEKIAALAKKEAAKSPAKD